MLIKGKKTAKLLAIILSLIIMVSMLPLAATAASDPTPVEGRILTKEKAGDTSAWIEIARYEGYSLIIRQEPLTSSLTTFSTTLNDNTYVNSLARKGINDWYNNKLGSTAKLRDFAVSHDAMRVLGSFGMSFIDGLSLPSGNAARTGNDVAFALSYCEAALYCSSQYATTPDKLITSSKIASANMAKLLPKYVGAYVAPAYWLRSPGNVKYAVGCVAYEGGDSSISYGRAYQHTVIGEYAHYRPALWVGSGIFGVKVTGKVWPMVSDDLGIGASFITQHDIVVELRSTFLTPASSALSTKAVLQNDDGLGVFTIEDVPVGDYILYIKRPGYLVRAMQVSINETASGEVTLSPPGSEDNGVFNLWGGDCNDDLSINGKDTMMILELMAEDVDAFDPLYNAACDMNADGLIDGRDIMMVIERWNVTIWEYPGSEDIDPFE